MKKLMISTIILLPLIILAIMLVSGAIMSLVTHIYVESVEFVDHEALVLVMEDEETPPAEKLSINVFPLKAKNQSVQFAVEDETIASVDEEGVVTAIGFGETYVTVTSKENKAATAQRKIIVTDDSVHSLVMGEYEKDLYQGDKPVRLIVEVLPSGATNKLVTWSSSAPAVLSVSPSGEVTCLGKGTAVITAASVENPEITATAEIECHLPLDHIAFSDIPEKKETAVVTAADRAQFPDIVPFPAEATYTVEYTSSDEDIAKVDATGAISFLKEGCVTVTAAATDGRGNTDSVSVKYDCTYGYYQGPLFDSDAYTFDYDTYAGQALGIIFQKNPAGSEREILSVEFDRNDLIAYDGETETFSLKNVGDSARLGTVKITVNARKYNEKSGEIEEFHTDICNVTITRSTKSLSFVKPDGSPIDAMAITVASINLTEELTDGRPSSGIGVLASPANHTDKLTYTLEGGGESARLTGRTLSFFGEGTAVVAVTAPGGAAARLSVSYIEASETDKVIEANGSSDLFESLNYKSSDNFQTGILQFTTPEGYTASLHSSDDEVVHVESADGVKLIPGKGGFADITVSFIPNPASEVRSVAYTDVSSFTVHVYVDRPVLPANISFDKDDGYTTSLEAVSYSVELNVSADAMEGKEIFVCGTKENFTEEGGKLIVRASAAFGGQDDLRLTVSVKYDSRATECDPEKTGELCNGECTVRTTHGKLISAPTVTCEKQTFGSTGNQLDFANIGDEIVLTVDAGDPEPSDFVLTEKKISFTVGTDQYFTVSVAVDDNNVATVTLTAIEGTDGTKATTLQVAGQSFGIELTVGALADSIEVKYNKTVLEEGQTYATLLTSFDLTVKISRSDGKQVTDENKKISYTFGAAQQSGILPHGDAFTLSLSPDGTQQLIIESGTKTFTCTIEKRELDSLEYTFSIQYVGDHGEITVGPFGFDEGRLEATFPQAMQGSFDLLIAPSGDVSSFIGGFEELAAQAYFTLDEKEGWDFVFTALDWTAKYNVTPERGEALFNREEFTLHGGEQTVTVVLGKVDIQRIAFTDFDSNDQSNGGNVYKGYQQVRVFAKQSDYGDGNVVDYFRVPLIAESNTVLHTAADLDSVVWNLVRHSDASGKEGGEDTLLTSQHGKSIVYQGVNYTVSDVEGCSTLMQGGTVIAQAGKYVAKGDARIPWVDVFAEDGYAHIYFGNFGGLSESDVQNDYFGNFGEQSNYIKTPTPTDDNSGRTFAPSANAYSFLRVEAGDGAVGNSVNAHFNFNVLQDANLVNVFDVAGYLANNKIVLHNDLYGADEKPGAPAGQVLTEKETAKLAKNTIYGNGYQVNLKAYNETLPNKNEGKSITFNNLYNVKMKGDTENETLANNIQKVYFYVDKVYYCDMSYYFKLGAGKLTYIKNSVFHDVPKVAIQVWNNQTGDENKKKAYIENITIASCGSGVNLEGQGTGANNSEIYLKGFFDVLNYANKAGIANMLGYDESNFMFQVAFPAVVSTAKNYFEWFGNNVPENKITDAYVNIAIYASIANSETKVFVWGEDDQYATLKDKSGQSDPNIKIMQLALQYYAGTYDVSNTVDGGTVANADKSTFKVSRDMSKLFTDERYIRLLCEYKNKGEKNDDHILWHRQKVYRDMSLIEDREEDHIEHLKSTLKGVTWPDDTNANDYIGDAAAINELISQAVIPEKRAY